MTETLSQRTKRRQNPHSIVSLRGWGRISRSITASRGRNTSQHHTKFKRWRGLSQTQIKKVRYLTLFYVYGHEIHCMRYTVNISAINVSTASAKYLMCLCIFYILVYPLFKYILHYIYLVQSYRQKSYYVFKNMF